MSKHTEAQPLADVRKAARLTQQELANRAGVSISTVTSIEKGRHAPRLDRARKIALALNVPFDAVAWPMEAAKRETEGVPSPKSKAA